MDLLLLVGVLVAGLVALVVSLVRTDGLGHRPPPASEGHWAAGTEWGTAGWPTPERHRTRPALW